MGFFFQNGYKKLAGSAQKKRKVGSVGFVKNTYMFRPKTTTEAKPWKGQK